MRKLSENLYLLNITFSLLQSNKKCSLIHDPYLDHVALNLFHGIRRQVWRTDLITKQVFLFMHIVTSCFQYVSMTNIHCVLCNNCRGF